LIPSLHRVFQDSDAETRVAKGALFGLAGLRANDQTSIAIFEAQLSVPDHRFVATNGLLRTNKPEARQALIKELSGYSADNPFSLEERILFALAQYPDTREVAVGMMRASLVAFRGFPDMLRSPEYLELFGDSVDVQTEELLRTEADPPEFGTHVTGRRAAAIRGLAKRDIGAAFDAAARALSKAKNERHIYPDLLIELDAEKAVPILCNRFRRVRKRLVRRAIGIALRTSGLDEQVLEYAESWLLEGDATARCRAAQLARWMGPPFLESSLREILSEKIAFERSEVCTALADFERQRNATILLQRLSYVRGIEAWCYLDALFSSVDPTFLAREKDILWIGPALDSFPDYLRRRTNELYAERLKKTIDEIKFPSDDDD
jgi:hypothetical protein